jgi:5'-nucleotidase
MADRIRDYAQADIGLQNSGGIRKDIAAGPVTYRDLWEISPFGNEIVRFRVTGAQLRQMFLFQARKSSEFCQVGGMAYAYDERSGGEPAFSISVGGAPVDDARSYTVATNSFVGGHLFDFFSLPEASIAVETVEPASTDRDVFIAAIKRQPRIVSSLEGRITIRRKQP